jgi:cell division protein FtsI/penicillin-binding protein 2
VRLKVKPLRLLAVLIFFLGLLFIFLGKLVVLQFVRSSFLSDLAAKQHLYYLELEPKRGAIYDRKMKPVAVNVATFSLYAVPSEVKKSQDVVNALVPLLGVEKSFLKERLSRKKQFVWLARKLEWELAERVKALDLDGLYFIKESKRSYPNTILACQLIGFAGLDNTGLDGLELQHNTYLKGVPGCKLVLRDAKKRDLSLSDVLASPVDGYSLVLTIDQVVQYIAEREIEKVFRKYKAQGAMIVVMSVTTGEILAMASRPNFDLNDPCAYPVEARRNRAVTDFFEPGSVFKIVTATAALDEGHFCVEDTLFCENGEYRIGRHILHDVHPYGDLTFAEVITCSSNIGTTKIAEKIGPEALYHYAKLFGFGKAVSGDIPGEVDGILKPVSSWSKTSISAVAIGQEVCVTTLQLTAAIAALANKGVYMKPFVVRSVIDHKGETIRKFRPQTLRRVMSEETSRKMREILKEVVENGTGKMARSEDFQFAGKTGTAQKVGSDGAYSHSKFMASFIGFAPFEDPQIAIAVVVDEPSPYYYGGVVSAPVFKAVAEDVLKYMRFNLKKDDET